MIIILQVGTSAAFGNNDIGDYDDDSSWYDDHEVEGSEGERCPRQLLTASENMARRNQTITDIPTQRNNIIYKRATRWSQRQQTAGSDTTRGLLNSSVRTRQSFRSPAATWPEPGVHGTREALSCGPVATRRIKSGNKFEQFLCKYFH